jgi:hypothetical protein
MRSRNGVLLGNRAVVFKKRLSSLPCGEAEWPSRPPLEHTISGSNPRKDERIKVIMHRSAVCCLKIYIPR